MLYRVWDLSYSESFSVLRTYRAEGGQLLQTIGSFSRPVRDFAYFPGLEAIMVAFTDGTVEKWEIGLKPRELFWKDCQSGNLLKKPRSWLRPEKRVERRRKK